MINQQQQDRVQLSTLWRLRGKLTVRQFTRERGRIVGAALIIFFFGPMILGAAVGTAVGYRQLPPPWPTALLGGVLTLLWLIWLVFPILFTGLNEGADITQLMIYPIRRRTLITAVLLGTLFDYPTYLMLPLFLAVIYGFGLSLTPAALLVFVALALSYGHLVMIGQFMGTAVGGLLQSRRLRDVAIVIFSLIGGMCYFINIGVQRMIQSLVQQLTPQEVDNLRQIDPLAYLQWLPPAATAQAINQSIQGEWVAALGWLLYSLAWLVVLTWAWYKLLLRLTTGEGYLITARPQAAQEKAARQSEARQRHWLGWLPADIAELAAKEFKSLWRVPQRRVGVIQGVLLPIFFLGAFFFSGDNDFSGYPRWMGLAMPLYALFLYWTNTQNQLAWEGNGLATLLLTPLPRQRIFWAKGVALWIVTAVPVVLFGAFILYQTWGWVSMGGLITALAMGWSTMGVTAVGSVIFPIPIRLESRRGRSSWQSGGDTKTGCAYITLVPLAILVLGLPALLPLLAAYLLELPWLLVPGLLFSMAYGVAIFMAGCKKAGQLLLAREPEVLARLKVAEEG